MESGSSRKKPRLAVWKFASCDGCQLVLLNCDEELLHLSHFVEIAYFAEASSNRDRGNYDLSLVDGSISTLADIARIVDIRRRSKYLMTLGACATSGGIQALRNLSRPGEFASLVYARPDYIESLNQSTPISAHVRVDFELQGCPINQAQLLEVIHAFLQGRKPTVSAESVCIECKIRGNVCIMVARGISCMGPITHAGCGALCPSYNRGCYSCYGPKETPNLTSLESWCHGKLGSSPEELKRGYSTYYVNSETYRKAVVRDGKEEG